MESWPTWLIVCIVQSKCLSFVGAWKDLLWWRKQLCSNCDSTLFTSVPTRSLASWLFYFSQRFQHTSTYTSISILQFKVGPTHLLYRKCLIHSIVINQPLPGVYVCGSMSYGLLSYSVFPTLAFESVVFFLCVWVGYLHSKENFAGSELQWSRAHIIDILVQHQ